ncbi:MAG: PEGA domain-containing protein [Deltaproteobacteria bacterium]|nr:PEGA domain-containing protein [Deltaproteobacteria bacterium]
MVGLSARAEAQPKETFGIVALDRSLQGEAAALEAYVAAWAEGSQRLVYIDAAAFARGDQVALRKEKGEKALAEYKAGLDAYDAMDYEASLGRLAAAIELFEQADLTVYLDGLLDAYAARALALFYAGRVPEARNQLIDLHTLRPDYAFDSSRLTPDIESHVEDARRSAEMAPPTALEVQVAPVPARVFVDGRYAGVTPLEVPKLSPGNHIVSVFATGYAFAQEKQLAAAGQIARYKLKEAPKGKELLGKLERIRGAFRAGGFPDAGGALAQWAGAEQATIIVLQPSDSGPPKVSLARFGADGHYFAHEDSALKPTAPGAGRSIEALLDKLHATNRPRGPKGEPIKTMKDDKGFISKIPVGVYPGVAGAAGIVGGIAFGLSAKSKEKLAHDTPQIDTAGYEAAMKQARSQALAADIFYVVGAAGVGVATWLFLRDMGGGSSGGGEPAERDAFSMSAAPIPGGGVVVLRGTF